MYLVRAHINSKENLEILQKSELCGCFYCKKTYCPCEINDWLNESNGKKTAVCPYCGIDSVISESTDYLLTKLFLESMHNYWFETI